MVRTVRIGATGATFHDGDTHSELDSHADTCVVGKHALIIADFDRPVNVTGFNNKISTLQAKTVSAVVAYDDPMTGETIILIIHQAIYIPSMENNLLCPMQMRLNDVKISEIPKFLTERPADDTHAISVREMGTREPYLIPLALRGVTSVFPSRKPTAAEYENDSNRKFELTFEIPEWDPHSTQFAEQEAAFSDSYGRIREPGDRTNPKDFFVSSVSQNLPESQDPMVRRFLSALQSNVNVSSTSSSTTVSGVNASARMNKVDPMTLSKRWGISIESARRTIKVTAQRGVRTVLHPSLSRRYRTNDRQLRYRRLRTDLFGDTLEASVKSRRQNRYAQVFGTSFGWSQVFPVKRKSDVHEGLSLLIRRDGVPPKIIVDGSKEQTKGVFAKKMREADCWLKQTEPYSQWQNAAEGVIRELKRGAGRKMVKTRTPKVLWDNCLEYESMIRSNTAHDIYELGGEVPETIVSGETSDISQLCELGWYEWCKFRDVAAPFPEDKQVLGRYLGPSIDIGPAMTAKILKTNGQVIHSSTYRPLTPDEMALPDEVKAREVFDEKVGEILGTEMEIGDIEDDEVETPVFEPYKDNVDGKIDQAKDADDEEVTPEEMDGYLGATVLLPLGDKMVSGRVRGRKRDQEGLLHGVRNQNPILDTRTYDVEFPNGEEAEYAANVIAENMYAQCDAEGNQYLLMESLVDFKSDGHAVKVADMYLNRNGRKHMRKTTDKNVSRSIFVDTLLPRKV